jgi:hypothetical protein
MNLLLLISLQAAASPAPPPAAIRFDLAKVRRAPDVHGLFTCDRSGGDVVVCGHRAGPAYPLDEMARIFEAKPLRAEKGIGGGAVAGAHLEQVQLGSGNSGSAHSGLTSNRVMIGIKTPF